MARKKNDYWAKRDAAEKAWMASQLAKDERFNKTLGRTYQIALDNINRSIRADIDRIGGVQNLVTADQMAEYERLAQQAVEKANKLRQAGKTVKYEDFSPYVNERLKVYNATMRVNQQEMLKSQIGAQLVNMGIDVDTAIHDKVYEDYLKEKERQAGILKLSTSGRPSASVIDQTTGSIAVGNFSKNVWANVDLLKAQLDGVIATGFIAGDNPRKIARQLIDQVSDKFANARYAAERIARTESARIEYKAQLESVLENGYKYVRWYLEPSACRTCREIGESGDVKGYDDVYKVDTVPEVPVHPNCRCSIGAYWVDDKSTQDTNDKENLNFSNVNPSLYESHNLPAKAEPLSVGAKLAKGEVTSYRLYGKNGFPVVDLDLTDHGFPKYHPIVPHAHDWTVIISQHAVKCNRSKHYRELSKKEKRYIERWTRKYGQR